jgi:hypothetical protein
MENRATTLENLFENLEQFSKTSFELYKLKAIYEIASLTSRLAVRFILTIVVAFYFSLNNNFVCNAKSSNTN